MTVFYSHQLGVIDYAAFNSLFNEKLVQKLTSENKLSEPRLKKIENQLNSMETAIEQLNLSRDLGLDYHGICLWLQSLSDELRSSGNMFFYLKNELSKEMNSATLTIATARKTAISAYAETLLDKGKSLINNPNYEFNGLSIRHAIAKTAAGQEDEKLKKMPLYFNMHYFILEHGSRKLIEPQVLQEMFLC